jgi:hypothetical protein
VRRRSCRLTNREKEIPMKRTPRKLMLHRDTLHSLQPRMLNRAAGGGNTAELITGCACTDGCGGGTDGCGSNGCPSAGCVTAGCPGETYEIISGCATNC